jgi:cysteinyl-tRNA synthetase
MRLFDSRTREVRQVVPSDGKAVRMYSCGPTVYRYAHVGNMRTFMLGDLIRRGLRLEGQEARWIMNITDVGHMTDDATDTGRDRMDLAVEDEGLDPMAIAEKYTAAFLEDADAVGIERADGYPKATDHIAEMIELTEALIRRGHAYEVEGSVYFDVRSFPAYGELSGNTLDALRAGHRQELEQDPNKRHREDFALWKKAGLGRLMKWDSPWGEGFPGWHIECSAMSMRYLGDRFDIHTGGHDLKFPHHEDEIAQSEGGTGHRVVELWVHGGFLRMSGRKMSKSRRNITRVSELADQGIDPLAFRLVCFGTRYRSEMDFSWEALEASHDRLVRLRQRMAAFASAEGGDGLDPASKELDARFRERIADDLDLPGALVVLGEAVSAPIPDGDRYELLRSWDTVLGLDLDREAREGFEVPADVERMVADRDRARGERDFERSDAIRARLTEMGWEVMDTDQGTTVRPLQRR